ncbi:T9SS type A sorting domain-containing protein [Aquimarina sediminis]|uniref:T9SS type A sorting domain-containing protein n=1 Tax=Aquimarina sediminis TaxID=2070536 RepID=UPI000CA044E7|nr:T9SS type A sorting domain-containing protein [Aquimarina sediminis]
MKRIVLIFIILLVSFGTYAQTYTITANGYIGSGPSSCGSNNNGLKWIKLYFSDGSIVDLFRQDGGQFRNRPYTFSQDFNVSRRLVGVRFRTVSRRNSLTGCRSSRVAEKTVNVSSPCFYRYYNNTEVYRDDINGWVTISIVPKIDLTFSDGAPVSSIYSGCEDGSIGITATPGFTPTNDVYTWEFLDNVNTETQNHPDYQALINAEAGAEGSYRACVRQTGDPDRCEPQFMAWMEAQRELNNYTGPRTIQVPVWRPISNKVGQSNIDLKLSDLYSSTTDQKSAVNKNIDIRMSPSCNAYNARTNQVTIQFIPSAPSISTAPNVVQPSCSYENDAEFTITFDRTILADEKLNISLKKLTRGQTPLPNIKTPAQEAMTENEYLALVNSVYSIPSGNNIDITNLPNYNSSTNSYTWDGAVDEGEYAIQISGHRIADNGTAIPFCKLFNYFFGITAPAPVNFTAENTGDQTCFGTNDGKLQIAITSGGAGDYEYSFNNGTSWTTFRAPRVEVTGLSPQTYNIQVRKKANQCLAKDDSGNTIVRNVTIDPAIEITHQLGTITNPGSPGASDGRIVVNSVSGGTPFTGGSGAYYNATVLINGSTTNTVTYTAYANGFDIDGLPAGNHKIRYTDNSSGCTVEIDLPVLTDPLPISFTVQKQDPSCSDADDGRFTLVNLSGGYPPYSITWRKNNLNYGTGTSITGNQGDYEVIVTDTRSGRAEQTNIRFDNVPLPITITDINIQPINCYGDQATVTITAAGGASGAYQYAIWTGTNSVWQNSNIFALNANTTSGYRFRVRDRNTATCLSDISSTQYISQPSEIRIAPININHNNVFGDNQGAIEIDVVGGNPGYTITWERNGAPISNIGTSISNLIAGIYVAVVRDRNNCLVRSVPIEITEPDELLVSIVETVPIPCYNETGTLSASVSGGSTNYTYQWYKDGTLISGATSGTLANTTVGNYRVHVEDGYTFKDASIVFSEPAALNLSASGTNILCYNENTGTIVLTPQGGTRPYSFSIDNKQTYLSENTLTNFTIEGLVAGSYEVWLRDANGCEISTPVPVTLTQPTEIVITEIALEDVTTTGGTNGSISIDVAGGVGIYGFLWAKQGDATFSSTNRDINNLSFGIYTVSVTDTNNCVVERTFEVREPLPIEVQISITNPILCYGDTLGELLATVSGGYPIESTPADFEYRWYRVENAGDFPLNTDFSLDRIQDLGIGTYKVVVNDSQGATAERTLILTQPEELNVTLANTPIDVLCYGEATGAIDITVTGGPRDGSTGAYLPYTFRWTKVGDPGFTATSEDLQDVTAGTYEVVVIDDNLCTTSLNQAVIIQQPDAPLEISNIVVTHLTGYQTRNGSISIDVTGGTRPYIYSWTNLDDPSYTASSQDISNLRKGNYQLSIVDNNGCSTSMTREVNEPDELIVQIEPLTPAQGIQCFGEETVVPLSTITSGGVGDYTYQWYEQANPSTILFTTPNTPTTLLAGTYTVVVTDRNGNTDSNTYNVVEPTEISASETVTNLQCAGDNNGVIDITIQGGVAPYTYLWSNGETTEDLTGLIAGNYTVEVKDANQCIFTKTITVQQPPALFVDGDIIRLYPSSNGARDGSITVTIAGGTLPYRYEWRDFNNVLQSSTTNVLDNIGTENYSLIITDANGCILDIPDVDLFEPPALEVTILPVNVISCYGDTSSGSISAIAKGGRPFNSTKQYNYQWFSADTNTQIGSDNFLLENIGGGNYYVIVSDAAGATATSPLYELEQPAPVELLFNTDYVACGDGNDWTIISEISGGTGPYTYLWNTGVTSDRLVNVVAGTYSVEITDARGCRISDQVTVNAPRALNMTQTLTIPTCYNGCDGTISIETEGGTPPYNYQWSNGAIQEDLTNICSGNYTVIITDSKGCQITREISVGSPEELIVDLGEDTTLCKDQSMVLNATIADPNAVYLWSSTSGYSSTEAIIEISEPGIYEVVVTDSKGCIASDSIFIDKVTDVITAQFITSTQVFAGEKFVVVDNSDPIPDSVDWILPEEAVITYEDDNYAEVIFETPGEYEITMKTYLGLCTAVSIKKVIVLEEEFEREGGEENEAEIQSFIDYLVYPNPTSTGRFNVEVNLSKPESISLKVYNIVNNTLIDSRKGDDKETYTFDYDMSSLPSGIYFILLETSSASQVRKLIIQ